MGLSDATLDLLRNLARKPGHDEVKAYFAQLLVEEFGADRASLRFEKRQPEICGRLDALIGRTVLEAKRDLDRELGDVVRRMPDYLADCEREHGEPFVGIASDGKRWIVYEMANGELVQLKETTLDPEQGEAFLAWLDGVLAIKGSLPPDALTIRNELGPDSIAFKRVDRELRALWDEVAAHPAEALKRQLWADMLKLVYGREVDDPSLWFRHSYLVIVTKCIALAVMDLREDDPKRMLSGEAFASAGIAGAVESDFFDWMVATRQGEELVRKIMAHVRRFRLREVESDVLKILYESLIDATERHGLGEYYTPDWLAAKVVRHAVDRPLEQRVLDPACGSGTFLFHAVRNFLAEAEDAGLDPRKRAEEACKYIAGVDIHPVAVIIARVTFLLALAPALGTRAGGFSVPVYLGDSMQLSIKQDMVEKELVIQVPPPKPGEGKRELLSFPETFCRDPGLFDKAIEAMRAGSLAERSREQVEAQIERETRQHYQRPTNAEEDQAIKDLGATYETFHKLRLEGRDTIWSYVARNLSRPLALASGGGWANVLVGNPPWVAYRHMSADLQKRFKALAEGENVYVGGRFATQNDLCGLFTVRASHLYLRPSGRLGFVLPLAVMTRGQFAKFREGRFTSYNIAWDEAWTMDDSVAPLFPVPACVVFGRKRAIRKAMPDKVRAYSGWLPLRDASEETADNRLSVREGVAAPTTKSDDAASPYRSEFLCGATLFPRVLLFVERKPMGRLGADPTAPMVQSKRSPLEKEPWRSIPSLEGQVEVDFLRPTLLGESILPYRFLQAFEAVVPVGENCAIYDSAKAEAGHYPRLSGWLRHAELIWQENAASDRLSLIERWNYQRGLANQFPVPEIRVVYAASGSQPAACIIRDPRAVIEHKLYWFGPGSLDEAHYLTAILNSEVGRARSAHLQSRGQFGARDFDKVIWNLPIPVFDAQNGLHVELARAGDEAEHRASLVELVESEKFQRARRRIRDALIADGIAGEIDELVEKLLDGAAAD